MAIKRSDDLTVRRLIDDLSRYQKTLDRIARLQERLDTLNAKLTSIGSPTITDMPRGGTPRTMDDLMADKIELEDRIKHFVQLSQQLRTHTLNAIDEVLDATQSEILERYFIAGQGFSQIGEALGYSTRQIERYFYDGLDAINLQEDVAAMSHGCRTDVARMS